MPGVVAIVIVTPEFSIVPSAKELTTYFTSQIFLEQTDFTPCS